MLTSLVYLKPVRNKEQKHTPHVSALDTHGEKSYNVHNIMSNCKIYDNFPFF